MSYRDSRYRRHKRPQRAANCVFSSEQRKPTKCPNSHLYWNWVESSRVESNLYWIRYQMIRNAHNQAGKNKILLLYLIRIGLALVYLAYVDARKSGSKQIKKKNEIQKVKVKNSHTKSAKLLSFRFFMNFFVLLFSFRMLSVPAAQL